MINIFYHKRDLDGHCSGAIAKYYFLEENDVENVKMWPYDYGEPFPFDQIRDDEIVWMVDITTNPYEMMLEINKRYKLTVVDHHKSFIESDVAKQIDENRYGEVGKAACELTWEYCFPGEKMPHLVKLLGRYDIWDNSDKDLWENFILPTQMGMKMRATDPSTKDGYDFWEDYFNQCSDSHQYEADIEVDINKRGSIILRYQEREDARACAFFSFPAKFHMPEENGRTYKIICLNSTRFNSKVFETVWDPEKYDFMLAWVSVQGERCSVSMYTDKPGIDVSEIAKKYGGGGHVQAAGFQCENVKPIVNMFDEKTILIERFA